MSRSPGTRDASTRCRRSVCLTQREVTSSFRKMWIPVRSWFEILAGAFSVLCMCVREPFEELYVKRLDTEQERHWIGGRFPPKNATGHQPAGLVAQNQTLSWSAAVHAIRTTVYPILTHNATLPLCRVEWWLVECSRPSGSLGLVKKAAALDTRYSRAMSQIRSGK